MSLNDVQTLHSPPWRRLPIGADYNSDLHQVHFRVWAPQRKKVMVFFPHDATGSIELEKDEAGYFSGIGHDIRPGTLYAYKLDQEESWYADPAARFLPQGPSGPAMIVDPKSFKWSDQNWKGIQREGRVMYEMHIGTFTPEGTWRAATAQLEELAQLGISVLEIMPVAEFPGDFGWSYDVTNFFAPSHVYGSPDDMRTFVDAAHRLGIGVILDVVYNHVGADQCFLKNFSEYYFTQRYTTEWGEAINFDGDESQPVREFFKSNAQYWITEFHLDGLRIDATQAIFDSSASNILIEIIDHLRDTAKHKKLFIVAESEPQKSSLIMPKEKGGYGFDAAWNDDFHHSAVVALTGRREAYYKDYKGSAQELISAVKYGYLYQGQYYSWQKKGRGTPAFEVDPAAFISYLQNHDQIANSACGLRIHRLTSPGAFKAITALMLLGPGTPMLFQGQEFASSSPFVYFAHNNPQLAKSVRKGRTEFLRQFASINAGGENCIKDPADIFTFEMCKLDLREREINRATYNLHRDLIRLRRQDPVFSSPALRGVDGAVLASSAFVIRFFSQAHGDRLLIVNLGPDLNLLFMSEPLLAAPLDSAWELKWSSEDLAYDGHGMPPINTQELWHIPSNTAVVLFSTLIDKHVR